MKTNWLYEQNVTAIVAVLFAAMLLSAAAGHWAGRRRRELTSEATLGHFWVVKASLFGLLSLLLAFTFGMAADRYQSRQRLVGDEANLIRNLALWGTLLPEPQRTQFQTKLREFLDARLTFFTARQDIKAVETSVDRTEALHRQLWELASEPARQNPTSTSLGSLLDSLTAEWTVHRRRVTAFEDRVPDGVIALLFAGALISMAAVGYSGGLTNHRGLLGQVFLATLISGAILVMLDLDRPRREFLQISQEPMIHLRELLRREMPATTGEVPPR